MDLPYNAKWYFPKFTLSAVPNLPVGCPNFTKKCPQITQEEGSLGLRLKGMKRVHHLAVLHVRVPFRENHLGKGEGAMQRTIGGELKGQFRYSGQNRAYYLAWFRGGSLLGQVAIPKSVGEFPQRLVLELYGKNRVPGVQQNENER